MSVRERKMSRAEVFALLNGEREYQQDKWGPVALMNGRPIFNGHDGPEPAHEVEGFILYMEHYLQEARRQISTGVGHATALDSLRKVVALGVGCFEQHGCPSRET